MSLNGNRFFVGMEIFAETVDKRRWRFRTFSKHSLLLYYFTTLVLHALTIDLWGKE